MAALPGLTCTSLTKEWTKALVLGQLAGLEELAHLLCEGGDGVGAVQKPPPLSQQPSGLLCGDLKGLLELPEFHDEVRSRPRPRCRSSL